MLSVQEMAARAHLERTLANERAIAESQSSTAAERSLARLRVQEANEALKALSAERGATEILRDIDELKAQLTRRQALAAGTRPLDEQSLTDFLERHRQGAEETTQKINEAMNALADQQQVLAGARQVRDRLDANEFESEHRQVQLRVDAVGSKAEWLALELRALRIELARSSIQSELWESRGSVMLTDSLEKMPQRCDLTELSRRRLELGREYFLSVQSNTQAELDALDTALRGASGTSPGHTWLVERRRELRSMQTVAQRALSAVIALGVFLEGSELHLNHLASRRSLTSWLQDKWQETGSALQAIRRSG